MQRPRNVNCRCGKTIANFNGSYYDSRGYSSHYCEGQTPEMTAIAWVLSLSSNTSNSSPICYMLLNYMCAKIEQEFGISSSTNEVEGHQEKLFSEYEADNG